MNKIKIAFLLCLVLIIGLPVFLPCLKNGFVWDDRQYLIDNSAVQALSLKNVSRIFTSFTEGNYHPVTFLSYLFEFHFFKLNPAGYHLINLILHLFNSLLVFWLFLLVTRSSAVSLVTSILFAIHPLHVESVAWVSGRKDVLYAFFFISAIISYLYHLKKKKGSAFYCFSLFLFLLSALSKSMAVSLPLALFLVDYLIGRKFDKTALLDKVPFFVLSIVFAAIGFISQYTGGAVRQEPFILYDSFLNACYAVVFYLNKAFVPIRLSCFYPYPGKMEKLISFLGLFMACIILIKAVPRKYSKKLIFGLGFFLATLLPVLQLIPFSEIVVADRFTYIPLIGIFYLAAEGSVWLYKRNSRPRRFFLLVISAAILSVMVMLSMARSKVWKDGLSLWNDVLKNYPNVAVAHNNRGLIYLGRGEYDKARLDFQEAMRIGFRGRNRKVYLYLNFGFLYRAIGKNEEAIAEFKKAMQADPNHPSVYFNLGHLYATIGDKDKAISFYKKALEVYPRSKEACLALGDVYDSLGKKDDAIAMFNQAIQIDPAYLPGYLKLIGLYAAGANSQALIPVYKNMITNNLEYFDAYYHIADLYSQMHNYPQAISLYKKALKINPNSAPAYINLGKIYYLTGRFSKAIISFKKAISLDPSLQRE
jgi:protein O-mannosyl-transferase